MKSFVSPFRRFIQRALIVLSFFAIAKMGWGQVSILNTSTITENLTGYAGTSTVPSNWEMTGSGSSYGFRGIAQTTGTSGGWYGNGNMSFLGSSNASNGRSTWKLQNNTGATLSGFNLSFTAALWKTGTASPIVRIYYIVSSSSTFPINNETGWTELTSLSFSDATTGITTGATMTQNNITVSVSNGNYIYLRWLHPGGSSSDNLGWDAINFSAIVSTPTITGTATTTSFTSTYGTASIAQTFSISGNNLSADLVATAPTGFEVSSDGTNYSSTATFAQTSGSASGTLSIRLAATAAVVGSYNSQNIVLSSTGATSVNISTPITGNVVSAKALTITGLSAADKNYDGNTSVSVSGTPVFSGLVNNESFQVTGSVAWAFPDANVGSNKNLTRTGNYNLPSTNYSVTQPALTASINAVVPSSPTITSITSGNEELSVAFTSPSSNGGTAITNYEYSINGGNAFSAFDPTQTTSPLLITSLSNGVSYDVQIRAVNGVGSGAASSTVQGTPTAAAVAPGAPTITSVTAGNGQLSVAFTEGATGGSTITNYKYSTDGGTTFNAVSPASTASPIIITGLTNGTPYNVQIKAVNAVGDGAASVSVSGTPATTPSAPNITAINPGNGQLSVAFTEGSTGGSTITNYKYSTDGGASFTPVSPASTSSPIVITGLTNGTTYDIQIKAVNAIGDGTATSSVSATPYTTPGAPTIGTATAGNGQATITFTAPVSNGGSPIISYTATSTPGGITGTISQAGSGTITVNGLTNGTTYTFTVVATNAAGSGEASAASNSVNVTLPAPTATIATSILNNGFNANWGAVVGASSGYLLDVSTSSTFENLALASDLFISEYVEGNSNNKYIEIYNGTGLTVDLSLYELGIAANGSATPTYSAMSGSLVNGATIVYKNSSAALTLPEGVTAITSGACNFNGDDAIVLHKVGAAATTFVDVFGVIGNDPGTSWSSTTNSTLDKTLRRKSTITSGIATSPTGTGSGAFTSLESEWTQSNIDVVSGLGSHSITALSPSFVSGYSAKPISGQSTASSEVTGLSEATTYYYRVRATDGSASANSNVITVTTKKTPTVTPIIGTYTYTGSAQGPNAIVSQTPTPTSVTYSYTGTGATTYGPSATLPTNAGSYNVTATVQADDNYVSGSATSAFTIAPAPLTITANNQTKCEGSAISFTGTEFSSNGLVNNETISTVSLTSGGSEAGAVAGTYTVVPSWSGSGSSNYAITYANGFLTVSAPSVFRSYQSGNWSSTSTWEQGCGGSYYAAVSLPANTPVTIQNGHSVVANINVSVSNLAIESNSTLVVSNNRILSGGTITNSGTLDILSGGQLLQGSDTDISGGGTCIYRKELPQV
ncbi:MAG: hypothetical protein RLZZ71_636, partial [Bacteroidota bacterium]